MSLIHLLLGIWLTAALSLAQASSLIEASAYLARAEELYQSCADSEAEHWLKKAIDTVRRFQPASREERDAAGALLARLEIRLEELRQGRRRRQRAAEEIERLIREGALESARRVLLESDARHCDRRLAALAGEVESRRRQAQNLVERGDRYLREGIPDAALRHYEEAQRLNREQAELVPRMAEARAILGSSQRPGAGRKTGKAVLYATVAVAIGSAGYFSYRISRQRTQERPPRYIPIPPPVTR